MADGDLYLSDSPNVDKGFVEQDGQLRGVKLQAIPDGTLELSNSANVSTGYVTDTDGKKTQSKFSCRSRRNSGITRCT